MAQHGPDLFSNDLGYYMREEYKKLSYFGFDPEQIIRIFKTHFLRNNNDRNDHNLFWLILARIQVNYGVLCEEVKNEALKVIDSGEDIQQWKQYSEIENHLFSYPAISQELIETIPKLLSEPSEHFENDLVDMFKKIEKAKLEEFQNQDNLPDEVHRYLKQSYMSKIMVFGLDGNKYYMKRIQVLDKLKKDIENFSYDPKKLSIKIDFDPKWKIGDIYTIRLDDIQQSHFGKYLDPNDTKYIAFEVFNIIRKPISTILPELAYNTTVYIKVFLYLDDKKPTLEQLVNIDYMPRMISNFFVSNGPHERYSNHNPQIYDLSFYNSVRAFNKLKFIQLRVGNMEYSEDEINTSETRLVFAKDFQGTLIYEMKKYLKSLEINREMKQ